MNIRAAVILTSLISSPAIGQSAPGAAETCLKFDEALEIAARVSPAVGTASARLAESEAQLMQARSLFRPQISSFARTGFGDTGLSDSRIENQLGVRVSQRVFDFGDSAFAREAARAAVASSEFDVKAERGAAAVSMGVDYLGWLETNERINATQDRVTFFQQQLAATENVLSTGGATVSDRADVEAELLEAESAKTELDFLLERFAAKLAINTKQPALPCSKDNADQVLARLSAISDLNDQSGAAFSNAQIEALRKTALSLAAQKGREKASRFPVVSVGGISSYAFEDFSSQGAIRNRIGVDVSVPLYSGNAQTARIAAAEARTQQAVGRVEEATRQLEEDVSITRRRIASLEFQTVRRGKAAETRGEQLAAATVQYQNNLKTLPELIEVRLLFESALLSKIETEYELLRNQLRLAKDIGAI
jgi:outer membrane protein